MLISLWFEAVHNDFEYMKVWHFHRQQWCNSHTFLHLGLWQKKRWRELFKLGVYCIPIWVDLLFFHQLEKWLPNFYYFPWTFLFYSSFFTYRISWCHVRLFKQGRKDRNPPHCLMLSHDIFLTQQNIHDPYGKNTRVPLLVILNIKEHNFNLTRVFCCNVYKT
jgi:hypothetical protein